ncbi:flagellar filament capping protein FliD [Nocardioides campestrisoli]|uniref:flagellar filament capping protein FliD n=1 Tax=Nocardioides campestrisoli TaxID=2736757 RepID=UPI00163D45DF|nr:flagellar filament capping protein FliD [Nocardioides campestrisoli]
MASISGLSGFDSAQFVDQLMQLETAPKTRLQTRVRSEESAVSALQTLNTRLAALSTKAADTGRAGAWSTLTASSTTPGVTATATAATAATSFSVTVDRLARTHQLTFAAPAALTGSVTGGATAEPTTVRLDRLDGTAPLDLETDGTLQGLVDALNDPANETGVRATAVRVAEGSYRLLVESTATGAASDFALSAADGSPLLGGATARAGEDAAVTLGGITATSSTNTFDDLMPGVTLSLAPPATAGSTATLTIAREAGAVQTAMKSLVDDINSLLTSFDTVTASGGTGSAKGMLAGDVAVRGVRTALFDAVYPKDGTTLAELGIQTDRYGKLVLDEKALAAAYEKDPEKVAAALGSAGEGFAARVRDVAKSASAPVDGTLTVAVSGRQDGIKRLADSVAQWDLRLELRRTTLTRQFTALETALTQMQSQSTWLAGQIGSLPSRNG